MKKLLIYLRDYKKESILAPAFKMLEATFDLLVPLVMAAIINTGIANKDKGYILSHCGLLILLGVIGLTCSITAQYFAAKASVGFCTKVRHVLFSHIQSLGFAEMDKLGTSTLITRMTSDINQVQSGLNLFLRLFLRSPFIVFGSIVMAFIVSPKAAVIFVVTIPLLSIVVFGIMLITMPLYRKVQGSLDGILGVTRENLTGVRVIRAFGREEQEKDRFEENNGLLVRSQLLVGKISALMNPLTYVMINLAVVVILNTGAVQIHLGNMQQGDVVALVNYMNQILIELVKLANLIIQVTKAMACAERVASVLSVEPEMEFSCPENNAKNRKTGTSDEEVAFDHVSFTYGGAGAETLSNIHFTVKKDRPWVSLAEPEAENPRWSICWHVFMMQRTDRSASAVTISEAIQEKSCVARLVWSCKKHSCFPVRSVRTFFGAIQERPMRCSGQLLRLHRQPNLYRKKRNSWMNRWSREDAICPEVRNSV